MFPSNRFEDPNFAAFPSRTEFASMESMTGGAEGLQPQSSQTNIRKAASPAEWKRRFITELLCRYCANRSRKPVVRYYSLHEYRETASLAPVKKLVLAEKRKSSRTNWNSILNLQTCRPVSRIRTLYRWPARTSPGVFPSSFLKAE